MSYLWHGYVAFQKPVVVAAGDWTTALENLRLALNETPLANSPSECWHSAVSGDTTIAEGMFDLSKLNTVSLTAIAGVDMTDAWEMLRLAQSWDRSREKAHSLVKDRGWILNGYTPYHPEDYGTIDGTPANDTAAVQAAINAAIAAGRGRVDGRGATYQMLQAGTAVCGLVPTMGYALRIDGDNVGLENMTLALNVEAIPDTTRFTGVIIGNGGGATRPGENGTWRYNNWLKNVIFDGTSLSVAQRAAISGTFSGTLAFWYCQDFVCKNCTIINGWGSDPFMSLASSRYGAFIENDLQSHYSKGTAFWIDGGRYVALIANTVTMNDAFAFVSNMDNTNFATGLTAGIAKNNVAINNVFTEINNILNRGAAQLYGADDCAVVDNLFTSSEDGYFFGLRIASFTSYLYGTARSDNCLVQGNTFTTLVNSPRTVYFEGLAEDENDPGSSLPVMGTQIIDNTFIGFYKRAWFTNIYCNGITIRGNTFPEGTTLYGYASANDEATIVANNALQYD